MAFSLQLQAFAKWEQSSFEGMKDIPNTASLIGKLLQWLSNCSPEARVSTKDVIFWLLEMAELYPEFKSWLRKQVDVKMMFGKG
jgi:hypothetical protein